MFGGRLRLIGSGEGAGRGVPTSRRPTSRCRRPSTDGRRRLEGTGSGFRCGGGTESHFRYLGREDNAIAQLHGAGFILAATVVRGGGDVFATPLPPRLVYVIGAEGEGMDPALAAACDLRLSIPGSGAVESLNVAAATAVLLAQWIRSR